MKLSQSKDARDFRKMVIGMLLIMSSSLFLHITVFSKKERAYRHIGEARTASPSPDALVNEASPVEGKVVAIGTERFYLDVADGHRRMFLFGNLEIHPVLDQKLRVYFQAGTPPTAIKVENLEQTPTK
jgi:hypothetical protein